jgi:uncharacterized protein GlcG (DUF336 family)
MNLSHAEAQAMIAVVQKRLELEKKAAAIAVTDSHGESTAFFRMDGCQLPPVYNGINKASLRLARQGPRETLVNHPDAPRSRWPTSVVCFTPRGPAVSR